MNGQSQAGRFGSIEMGREDGGVAFLLEKLAVEYEMDGMRI